MRNHALCTLGLLTLWLGSGPSRVDARPIRAPASAKDDRAAAVERACEGLAANQRAICPLSRFRQWVRAVRDIDGGALVLLSTDAGTAGAVAQRLRCHAAFVTDAARHVCPSRVRGFRVEVRRVRNDLEVRLTTAARSAVEELRRLVRRTTSPRRPSRGTGTRQATAR